MQTVIGDDDVIIIPPREAVKPVYVAVTLMESGDELIMFPKKSFFLFLTVQRELGRGKSGFNFTCLRSSFLGTFNKLEYLLIFAYSLHNPSKYLQILFS